MTSTVRGTIRGIAKHYADGTEAMEIWIPKDRASGLPFSFGIRVSIDLKIDGKFYLAGLRATENNSYVWICPNVKTSEDKSTKLAHVLASAGFKKNDKVFLISDEKHIEVKIAAAS